MNKEQTQGEAKEIAGNIQEHTGKLIRSKEQEANDHAREQAGKALKSMENLNESLKNATKR